VPGADLLLQPVQPLGRVGRLRIGEGGQQVAAAADAAAGLLWTGPPAGQADDATLVGASAVRLLHEDLVPPVVAEVVDVREPGALPTRDAAQRDTACVLDRLAVEVVRLGTNRRSSVRRAPPQALVGQ
jgi:hypothetical protein